jgi:diguanylate cyclase (GGDEF)-like protein
VVTAQNGEQAWRIAQEGRVRIVIAQWQMPCLDGTELCTRIRGQTGGPYTYIILIAAPAEHRDRLEALTAGADDLLAIPIDSRELTVRLGAAQRILVKQGDLERANARLARQATIDDLTGLKNRRHFREALDAAFSYAVREDHPLSVIMLDVDQFKHFNDTYGHPAGDEVLRSVADSIRAEIRPHDLAARLGGDEFAVMLPAADGEAGVAIAERLRIAVSGRTSLLRPVTVSLGIATVSLSSTSASKLIAEADEALYISKQAGRNRITHYQSLVAASTRGPAVGACPSPA